MCTQQFFVYGFYLHLCFCVCAALNPSLSTLYLLFFICRSKVVHTWALSISLQQCSLPANPVILRYIYVLGAEPRLAVTCVREVVALMEFYTWQPSRQRWYVFKILSRNKTRFCYLLGQVGLFLSLMACGGPGDSTGSWWHSRGKVYPTTWSLLPLKKHWLKEIKRFSFSQCVGCTFACMHILSVDIIKKTECMYWFFTHKMCTHTLWHTHTCTHWLLRHSCSGGGFLFSVCIH